MADFNGDGRFDGYDVEYIGSDDFYSAGADGGDANVGCGDILKFGCLVPFLVLLAASALLTLLAYACTGT